MRYRVNYGNGQVSESFRTKRAAFAHLAEQDLYRGSMYVQFYAIGTADDPGDWFRIGVHED